MARDGMRDVVLVDDDVDAVPPDGEGRAVPGRPGRRDGPRRARRLLVLAAALTAVVLGGAVVQDAQERERAALVTDVAGVLDPVGPSLRERWRVPAGGEHTPTPAGDLLVSARGDRRGDGRPRDGRQGEFLLAIGGATGTERWSAPLPEVSGTGSVSCLPLDEPAAGGAGYVVCRLGPAMEPRGFGRRVLTPGARTVLAVLDARTGARVASRTLETGYPSLGAVDGELLLAEVEADGHVRVTRQKPLTGRTRWTFRSPVPVGLGSAGTPPAVRVHHGVVAVDGPAAWALRPDGTLLGSWSPQRPGSPADVDPSVDLRVLPDGRFVVGEPDAGGLDGQPYGTVSATDARDGSAVPGPVLEPAVDDGSADGVLLTVPPGRGQLVAVDPGTGSWRWRVDSRGAVVVLDGRVVTRVGDTVTAVDAATGLPVWTTDVPARRTSRELLTDGRVLLVPTSTAGGAPRLTALGLDDGRERWSVPAPDGVERYLVLAGRLVAVTDRDVVGLG